MHVYDIDAQDGVDYIAMEFVAGRTLDQCIERKGLHACARLLKYRDPDCGCLERGACGRYRAPRPEAGQYHGQRNMGWLKLLDFGLAKLTEPLESDVNAPTATIRMDETPQTEEGTIVGTVAYMSPEQAEGKKVDARTDIFSFRIAAYMK